jgi:hypothetical protein
MPLPQLPRDVVDAALKETSDKVKELYPSTASVSMYEYGGTIARAIAAAYAGRLIGWGLDVSGDEAYMIGGVMAVVIVIGWGAIQKRFAAWRTNQAARASAAASAQATVANGTPTVVTLEPAPNKV